MAALVRQVRRLATLQASRTAKYPFLRSMAFASGSGAAYLAMEAGVPAADRVAEPRAEVAPAGLSAATAAGMVVCCAPLAGLSSMGFLNAMSRAGSFSWLCNAWERPLWMLFFGGAHAAAAASAVGVTFAQSADVASPAARVRCAGAATSACALVAITATERLGSSVGRIISVPLVLLGLAAGAGVNEVAPPVLAGCAAATLATVILAPPVYTFSTELAAGLLWACCALVPAVNSHVTRQGAGTLADPAKVGFEQLAGAVAMAILLKYLTKRRPICQY